MICYRCRQETGKDDYCSYCGTDLRVFQKALRISNTYYNDGLEKAKVHNLSGAIISLKRSLKFDKRNIQARNLLGLVYYEIGEVVDALSEWVISKNFQPEDNDAGRYLNSIQRSQGQLSNISQTIRKYNQALEYCKQGNRDLALIQLRKVLSLNPRLVKGHQLMALLQIQEGKYEQARKSLRNAARQDANNTLTQRYMMEVNELLKEQNSRKRKKKRPEDDLISYQSGNETIIMPKRFREYSFGSTLVYLMLGLAVGAAVTYFLIVPNMRKEAMDDARQQILAANDTITTDSQTIKSLEKQIEELNTQLTQAGEDNKEIEARIKAYEQLLNAYVYYTDAEYSKAGETISKVKQKYLSENAKTIYASIDEKINTEYVKELYKTGYQAYNARNYKEAIKALQAVVDRVEDYEDGNAEYYLAQAYRSDDQLDKAIPYYQYILEKHPGTLRANTAKRYVPNE